MLELFDTLARHGINMSTTYNYDYNSYTIMFSKNGIERRLRYDIPTLIYTPNSIARTFIENDIFRVIREIVCLSNIKRSEVIDNANG